MAMMTMIARTIDGLPLVGTMQENEEVSLSEILRNSTTCQIINIVIVGKECLRISESSKDVV